MELNWNAAEILGLISEPAFLVNDNLITGVNEAASRLMLREGIRVDALIAAGQEEYASFSGGMLYVTLLISGQRWGASVSRINGYELFTMDRQISEEALRSLALAARELRGPLSNALIAVQQLEENTEVSHLNRGLHQLLRIVSNMSDAAEGAPLFSPEQIDADALFRETVQKAAALVTDAEIRYDGLDAPAVSFLDAQMLERAVLNLLSNALKFGGKGVKIQVTLHRTGNLLRLCICDNGPGIPEETLIRLHQRYMRDPVIEDGRQGIGLGMLLVRRAAARHGGAVLVDRPGEAGMRVTLTLPISTEAPEALHSNRLKADYAGEQDHVLLELSELLSADLY